MTLAAGLDPALFGHWPGFRRGPAYAISVQGNLGYVAAQSGGLLVLDLGDPASPRRVGGHPTEGPAMDIALSGNLACVAAGETGLAVFDLADPINPRQVGSIATAGSASKVAVQGTNAYLTGGDAGLEIFDLSDPVHPRRPPAHPIRVTRNPRSQLLHPAWPDAGGMTFGVILQVPTR